MLWRELSWRESNITSTNILMAPMITVKSVSVVTAAGITCRPQTSHFSGHSTTEVDLAVNRERICLYSHRSLQLYTQSRMRSARRIE